MSAAEADVLFPPATQSDVAASLSGLVFEKLADVGPSMNTWGDEDFVPQLAESWRFVDDRTLEFTLASSARWHDGRPVTADDVVFTHAVYSDSTVGAVAAPRLSRIAEVIATGPKTVTFRFSESYPEQFFDAVYHTWIIPEHLLGTVDRPALLTHEFGRSPVGSGPFRFVRWEPAQFVELAADTGYHGGRAGVPRIVWRFTADGPAALSELLAGTADVLSILPRPEDRARVEQADHLRIEQYPVPVYAYVGFNLTEPGDPGRAHRVLGNPVVRRALFQAIDRPTLVRAVLGDAGVVPPGPVTPILGLSSAELPQIPYDPDAARSALAANGWIDADGDGIRERDGTDLTLTLLVPSSSSARIRAAQILQAQWRRVGIDVRLAELEFNTFVARAEAGRFDMYFGALGQDPSPASLVDTWSSAAVGGLNYGRYSNPQVDRMMDSAMTTERRAVAQEFWRRALERLNLDVPALWVYTPMAEATLHRRLANVTLRRDQWSATMWRWEVDPDMALERDHLGR